MACEIQAEGHGHRALVLDISRTGLFVQTSVRLAPGTIVDVTLQVGSDGPPIALRARVARQKAVPSNLTVVAQGGVGLRILDAPPSYYATLQEQAGAADPAAGPGRVSLDVAAAGSAATGTRTASRPIAGVQATRNGQPAAPARAGTASLPRVRVRMKQTDGPRSRVLEVEAEDSARARAKALGTLGQGWEALAAEPL
jgi:hypothetical protein